MNNSTTGAIRTINRNFSQAAREAGDAIRDRYSEQIWTGKTPDERSQIRKALSAQEIASAAGLRFAADEYWVAVMPEDLAAALAVIRALR